MEKGSIVGSIDVAQVVLYTFWVFFIGLIIYLRREDKREGYPLVVDGGGKVQGEGWPSMPAPKTFRLPHGGTVTVPNGKADGPVTKAEPIAPWPGAPLEPTGNPMVDAVGPGSYAMRANEPDLTVEGEDKIVPLRVAKDFSVCDRDPDPRGMPVIAADGVVAGTVREVWVDRSEALIRYLEVEIRGGDRVLLPWAFSNVDTLQKRVHVASILASQFARVPTTASQSRITLREEDRICAYYGSGHLYATPARTEPLL
jgi:photosynthetic reaction center H subunit